MISIKNAMYTILKAYIQSICPNSGTIELQSSPSSFPYLTFIQMDNPSYKKSQDSGSKENHVQPMVQIDVYASGGNMYQAEQIIAKADECMQLYGWERIFGNKPMPSTSPDIARQTARYQAIVKQNAPNDFAVI